MKQNRSVEHVAKVRERAVTPRDLYFGHFRATLERGVEAKLLKILMLLIPVMLLRRIMSGSRFRTNVSAKLIVRVWLLT
jgi:hypothetical protein